MYKFYISIFLILSFNIISQELNTDFLASLPEEIAKDLELQSSQLSEKDNTKKIQNPSTRIKDLEYSLQEAQRNIDSIRSEIDRESQASQNDDLIRFGSDFFNSFQSTFLPISDPNFDSSYILDIGDELTVQLIGQINETFELRVKRDGTVNIPKTGNFRVAGLSYLDAVNLLQSRLSEAFIGIDSFISLSELRDMNVLILGQVSNPGMYTLPGGSNVMSLVLAAGGITAEGTYRNISHKRNNELLQVIDLYNVLIDGNIAFKHQLRSGDVFIVNPKGNEVKVTGGVSNEAIYELSDSEGLEDVLAFAGRKIFQTTNKIEIQRYMNNKISTLRVDHNFSSEIPLFHGDSIKVPYISVNFDKIRRVSISGRVNAPGEYTISDNTSLSELIRKAGSYTKDAYPVGGTLTRAKVKKMEEEFKDLSYNQVLSYLVASQDFTKIITSPNSATGLITFLSLLKEYEPSGRVIADFELSNISENSQDDIILEDGDHIHIPSFSNEVYVFGEVMNPGGISYSPMEDADYYIKLAGSFSNVADESRVVLIDPSGRSQILRSSLFSRLNEASIIPGSVIYIPREMESIDGINLASAVAPIISSFALSIASLNAINN